MKEAYIKSSKKRVLFVDDEINVLNSLRRSLHTVTEWDYSFVSSVAEAISSIQKSAPDIIISDMNMPVKDGFDLLRLVNENPDTATIPIVILTGNGEQDMKRRALDAGAIDLLNKPVLTDDLVTRIRNVLKLKEYQNQLENQNLILEERVEKRTEQLKYLHRDLIWRLAKVGELRDNETGSHVVRVSHFCRILGEECNLSTDEVDAISLASTLHDLGKVGIPDNILLKPGKLTTEEFEIMKTHAAVGAEILNEEAEIFLDSAVHIDSGILRKTAATIAGTHHEKWDGSGYPKGLKGEEIPLCGRIAAIADVYDALRSDRPYKKAFSVEKTLAIISENEGTHFDPTLVVILKKRVESFEDIRRKSTTAE
jgi:putative two-component system response regulator